MRAILKFVSVIVLAFAMALTAMFGAAMHQVWERIEILVNHVGYWYTDEEGVVRDIRKPRTEGLVLPELVPNARKRADKTT